MFLLYLSRSAECKQPCFLQISPQKLGVLFGRTNVREISSIPVLNVYLQFSRVRLFSSFLSCPSWICTGIDAADPLPSLQKHWKKRRKLLQIIIIILALKLGCSHPPVFYFLLPMAAVAPLFTVQLPLP